MKTLHSLIAGLRPASLILARRIAFPLLFLGAGLVLVQPCAAAPFEFEETGSLATARSGHTMTLLPNGQVLVAAGDNARIYLDRAELYDPATGTWIATGSLNVARSDHTAALLPNGKVLVAAGFGSELTPLASAELYDSANLGFSSLWQPEIATATRSTSGNRLFLTGSLFQGIPQSLSSFPSFASVTLFSSIFTD